MKAAVFIKPGTIRIEEKPVPKVGPTDALIRITTTTICGTDVHILKGEFPVKSGLIIGHEPVGVIEELGAAVEGYRKGQRVIVGAITPCGQCYSCLDDHKSQCQGNAMGGWRFGNTIDGCQAEYLLVPYAAANLQPIPDDVTDEQVLLCPDIMSTGFAGAEHGNIRIGDTVVIFAQGPIGLCATAGSKLKGATRIIAVDGVPERLAISRKMGADITINFTQVDAVEEIMKITNGQGVDVAIEALGTQRTFESCLRVLKPGGTLSSLGVYDGKLTLPADAFAAGLGDHKIITSLCPGGKERMRRLLNVVSSGRIDLRQLVTHEYKLDQIEEAYELFMSKRDGVLKIAIKP
jgi:threonine dehydrogenase-like Zn-dependent dehydrogenase